MRIRKGRPKDDPDVPLSPLIDCVFLLLIFFLVTSMFKKFEMLIPIELPDPTSSLSAEAADQTLIIGIDDQGTIYHGEMQKRGGQVQYRPIEDFASYLDQLAMERDVTLPLQFSVDRNTPVQKVINAMDIAQLQGFENVAVKTRNQKL